MFTILVIYVIAHRMMSVAIVGIILMVPVQKRVIKTDLQSRSAECIDIFSDKVMAGIFDGSVIRQLTVEHAVSIMMLCGHDRIFHPCFFCQLCQFIRIEFFRTKRSDIFLIFGDADLFIAHDPFPSCGNSIYAPMNKHSEACITIPLCPVVFHDLTHKEKAVPFTDTAYHIRS